MNVQAVQLSCGPRAIRIHPAQDGERGKNINGSTEFIPHTSLLHCVNTTWLKHRYVGEEIVLGPPTLWASDLLKEENAISVILKGGSYQEIFEEV